MSELMSDIAYRKKKSNAQRSDPAVLIARVASPPDRSTGKTVAEVSVINLGQSQRLAVMITPQGTGTLRDHATQVFEALDHALQQSGHSLIVTSQTVFLRDPEAQPECEALLREYYGSEAPVTSVVFQAPCGGAALALEAWAIGGPSVRKTHHGANTIALDYDGVRWVYCSGIKPANGQGVYAETLDCLRQTQELLQTAGSDFQHVVRTWFYLGGITAQEAHAQRYMELNRARSDFYHQIPFGCALLDSNSPRGLYPASTGIGTFGRGLVVGCVALQTDRKDVFLLPLENPQQTPAYAYHPKYSPKSPKFSRAMALLLGNYATTWISGTASIVDSESKYPGDVERQTEQTIDNIERLIAHENFAMHGVPGAGATLKDLAKVRVYLKRPEDFEKCRAVCQKRFGALPIIYAVADVCRPELLVEIEGVAFSSCQGVPSNRSRGQAQ